MFTRFFGLFAALGVVASIAAHLLRLAGLRGAGLEIFRWASTVGGLVALLALALGLAHRWWKRGHLRRQPERAVEVLTQIPPAVSARLDATLLPLVTSARLAGISVAVDLDRDTGFRVYRDPASGPIDEHTVFEVGSITKTFTALLLAQMVLADEVALEDPVSKHLPRAELGGATLLDLATHHAGLPRVPPGMLWAVISRAPDPYAGWDEGRLASAARRTTPRARPGSGSHYSNFGFAILGLALSRSAGMPYAELVHERICAPLRMSKTTVTTQDDGDDRRMATGHDYFGGRASSWHMAAMAPCGGIRSTAADMHRYLVAHLRPGESPLSEAISFAQAPRREFASNWQARLRGATEPRQIGLAWITTTQADGTRVVWHNGGTAGYGSFLGVVPERQAGIVALSNSVHSYRLDGGCMEILRSAIQPSSLSAA